MKVVMITDKSGLRTSVKLGEAVANYYVARFMDVQNARIRAWQQRQQEEKEKVRKQSKDESEEATE